MQEPFVQKTKKGTKQNLFNKHQQWNMLDLRR